MASDHDTRPELDTTSYDESCPLLHAHAEAQIPSKIKPTPLPKGQLAALCSVRLADPIAFTQIFPYVNEFMNDLHLTDDPSQIGFYSGLVESVFAIAQLCAIYQCAKLSDIFGRRPIIIIGTVGLAISTIFFGLSKTLAGTLVSRSLAGLCSGQVAVVHSVLGELTDSTNQALAYPIYGLFWPLGSIIGPLLGGTLSNPAIRWPGMFDYPFWRTFPYFLPCFVAGTTALIGVLQAYFFLEETLPSKRRKPIEKEPSNSYPYNSTENNNANESTSVPDSPQNFITLLSIPVIRALCISGSALSFIATSFDVVFVLFCYSPVLTGGLAFSASQIGYSLATSGAISTLLQLFFMPTLLRTFDIAKMYNFCMGLWPLTFIILPLLNFVARSGLNDTTGSTDAMVWIGIAVVLACSRIACLAYSVSMILVKENTPSPSAFGTTNGLVQFAMCLSRAFAPAFVSSCFALSVDNNLLGGKLWALIMVVVCLGGSSISRSIRARNGVK